MSTMTCSSSLMIRNMLIRSMPSRVSTACCIWLRRELIETLGYEPDIDNEASVKVAGAKRLLFASLILMFTMVDLLAKFMSDEDGVAIRFKEFLRSPDGGELSKPVAYSPHKIHCRRLAVRDAGFVVSGYSRRPPCT
jgi:hypothetical protein